MDERRDTMTDELLEWLKGGTHRQMTWNYTTDVSMTGRQMREKDYQKWIIYRYHM
jgi:hypothetical protein